MVDVVELASRLDGAARAASAIPQLSEALTLEDAYAVQKKAIDNRVSRGERQVGIKMGFTSRAKMVQMGISDMIWGRLTSDMIIEEGAVTAHCKYVHPRVEPEIAFLLKRSLSGIVTPIEALSAVEAVAPALELIDSRYQNFKFSLTDVVADNASSSGFVTGVWNRPDSEIGNLGLVLSLNGSPVQIGSTAGILGHPLRALVAAARFAEAASEPLQAGWIVMAGGATAAEALAPDTFVELEMERLGRVAFTIAG